MKRKHIYTYAEYCAVRRYALCKEDTRWTVISAEEPALRFHYCPQMDALTYGYARIVWRGRGGGWYLDTTDYSRAAQRIKYCPFCGLELPDMSTAGGKEE